MAKYDVFLVAAKQDRDKAELVAKRLKALKFKVFIDKDQNDTFDSKDARNAENSSNIVTLWSKNAVKSDWVRAAASIGRARKNHVQLALDNTVPYDPFDVDKRIDVSDLTAKNLPDGYLELVKDVSKRSNRKGLTQFLKIPANDTEKKEKWFDRYPDDPLSVADFRRRGLIPSLAEEREAKRLAAAAAASAASGAAIAATVESAASYAEPIESSPSVANPTQSYVSTDDEIETVDGDAKWLVPAVAACIIGLLIASYFVQKRPYEASSLPVVTIEDSGVAGAIIQ